MLIWKNFHCHLHYTTHYIKWALLYEFGTVVVVVSLFFLFVFLFSILIYFESVFDYGTKEKNSDKVCCRWIHVICKMAFARFILLFTQITLQIFFFTLMLCAHTELWLKGNVVATDSAHLIYMNRAIIRFNNISTNTQSRIAKGTTCRWILFLCFFFFFLEWARERLHNKNQINKSQPQKWLKEMYMF